MFITRDFPAASGGPARCRSDVSSAAFAPASTGGIATGEDYAFLKIRYKLPGEARFAAAVAGFGQILRGDTRVGSFSCEDVLALARPVLGEDLHGYRAEFLNLVRLAETAREMGGR